MLGIEKRPDNPPQEELRPEAAEALRLLNVAGKKLLDWAREYKPKYTAETDDSQLYDMPEELIPLIEKLRETIKRAIELGTRNVYYQNVLKSIDDQKTDEEKVEALVGWVM